MNNVHHQVNKTHRPYWPGRLASACRLHNNTVQTERYGKRINWNDQNACLCTLANSDKRPHDNIPIVQLRSKS